MAVNDSPLDDKFWTGLWGTLRKVCGLLALAALGYFALNLLHYAIKGVALLAGRDVPPSPHGLATDVVEALLAVPLLLAFAFARWRARHTLARSADAPDEPRRAIAGGFCGGLIAGVLAGLLASVIYYLRHRHDLACLNPQGLLGPAFGPPGHQVCRGFMPDVHPVTLGIVPMMVSFCGVGAALLGLTIQAGIQLALSSRRPFRAVRLFTVNAGAWLWARLSRVRAAIGLHAKAPLEAMEEPVNALETSVVGFAEVLGGIGGGLVAGAISGAGGGYMFGPYGGDADPPVMGLTAVLGAVAMAIAIILYDFRGSWRWAGRASIVCVAVASFATVAIGAVAWFCERNHVDLTRYINWLVGNNLSLSAQMRGGVLLGLVFGAFSGCQVGLALWASRLWELRLAQRNKLALPSQPAL